NAARIGDWTSRMRQVLDQNARQAKLPVIYNISGGTRQMLIGALYGCVADGTQTEKHLVQVVGEPLRSEFVDLNNSSEIPVARGAELSLDQYLELYGIANADPAAHQNNEQFFSKNRDTIERFASAILPRAPILAPVLAQATSQVFPDRNDTNMFQRGTIDPWMSPIGQRTGSSADAAAALIALDGIGGLRRAAKNDGKHVVQATRRDGAMLVRSQWLEAVLFNRIKQCLGHLPYVSVAATVPLRLRSGAARDDLGEIDVAVMIRSQLHIVEAKFASFGRRSRRSGEQSFAQLESLKRQLMGQYGRIVVVNPRETNATLSRAAGAFPDRARRAGIDLLLGPTAVDDAVQLLERLAG
ncbi:MAG: Card1-like endonuclease domain-containing protein, partial [Stellaceae bacterium]